ncbi:MAG: YbeD family protein [Methylophilaceae bacterium]|jgi:uncharacterized protein
MAEDNSKNLIDFPCHFPIKVIGEVSDNFSDIIISIIRAHTELFDASSIEMRGSSQGKYISLTCNIYVESKAQLDQIYIDLSKHPITKFVL